MEGTIAPKDICSVTPVSALLVTHCSIIRICPQGRSAYTLAYLCSVFLETSSLSSSLILQALHRVSLGSQTSVGVTTEN